MLSHNLARPAWSTSPRLVMAGMTTVTMMGELNRLVAVKAAEPVARADGPLVIRGRLRLLEDEASPLFYRLDAAQEV